ncbi:conjugal transfer protein TrbH [Rhizobium mesoamericanum]|uniref:conjugal transfer protein TrbH n=1 Tax=Rhizobium mesoamericanum TaxID=1079800 RepID=UPI0004081F82|nr:conjugal transfer protein TrbH [Rhizobium mesoamericanum]
MRKLLPFFLVGALLSGCQTADDALITNSNPITFNGPAAAAIAGDMASRFAEQIGSSHATTIKMDKDNSEYAVALEAALKGWGYTVITDGKIANDQKPVELAWSIDRFDGQLVARLATPFVALGRSYALTSAGAEPAGPLSVMQRN